jgi:NAD(P)-dependent dehydrogenase (short-subunit alcohol dehydrogenase family)
MLLKDKVAVIYGAGGAIGGAVGRAFAREGARVFLTGHGRRAVLHAPDVLRVVVLPDGAPGRAVHGAQQVRCDHDGHRAPLPDRRPTRRRVRPAQAAKEALTRNLSAELATQGIRVVGLRPQGMPESRTIKDAFEPRKKATGMRWEQWLEFLAGRTHTRRLMSLAEMANVAAFVASDRASGMTGTTVNLTMGSVDD